MKKKKSPKQHHQLISPWKLLVHIILAASLLALCSTLYFYGVLPGITHYKKYVTVPDLTGVTPKELDEFLAGYHLNYKISDSSYSQHAPPLSVLQQFPRAGKQVKINRKIYITINKSTPPMVPLPKIVDQSRVNASAVLRSNDLHVGEIIWERSPFYNLIKETRYKGKSILPGTPVPKGSAIDLVVGDGQANPIFKINSLIGASYEQALSKLQEWNLHVGHVEIPPDIDTTDTLPVVYKQDPEEGELVRVGDLVNIWLASPDYEPPFPDEKMD